MSEDIGATVSTWLDVVRRARLGRGVKTVAYYLAGRANNDGSHLYPGVARTAVECEISYATARRALDALRRNGLIQVVRRGNRRLRKSDEYRLVLAADLFERIDVPDPEAHLKAIETANASGTGRQARAEASAKASAKASATAESTLIQKSVDDAINAQNGNGLTLTQMSAHLAYTPRQEKPTPILASGKARSAARPLRERAADLIITIIDNNPDQARWPDGATRNSKITGALQLADLLIAEAQDRGEPIADIRAYLNRIGAAGLGGIWRRAHDNGWYSTNSLDPVWDYDGSRYAG